MRMTGIALAAGVGLSLIVTAGYSADPKVPQADETRYQVTLTAKDLLASDVSSATTQNPAGGKVPPEIEKAKQMPKGEERPKTTAQPGAKPGDKAPLYVGAYSVDHEFQFVTEECMKIIRSKRVLFINTKNIDYLRITMPS